MRRGPIRKRQPKATFPPRIMRSGVLSGISPGFPELSRSCGQVAHVLLTRPPLGFKEQAPQNPARLACIRHAASVRPEPGSNSPKKSLIELKVMTGLSFALQFSRNAFFFSAPPLFAATVYIVSRDSSVVNTFLAGKNRVGFFPGRPSFRSDNA